MSAAALTPRIRFMTVCDEAIRSEIEEDVYTLEGVRYQLEARSFPCLRTLSVYLLLSYPRQGTFHGRVLVVDDEDNERQLRYAKFVVDFVGGAHLAAVAVDLGECSFPAPRAYTIKVEFTSHEGGEVLKGETTFLVLEVEE